MKFQKILICISLILLLSISAGYAKKAENTMPGKKFDLSRYHNVGNIWMRVSNYGFFGSGDDVTPQWPSLEYPGGSGIDYLYQGSLWFGAKKYRRNLVNKKLYWLVANPTNADMRTVAEGDTAGGWNPNLKPVIDTLVTVGFDGDADLYEFLPAYNPLESGSAAYEMYNITDMMAYASTRYQKRGVDDDGDGIVDEDFVGYTFPLRTRQELPNAFKVLYDGHSPLEPLFIHDTDNLGLLTNPVNFEIWFPLGFMELSDLSHTTYNFSEPYDDDNDGLYDEDGAPVSEQDFIAYYYDYSPHKTPGDRDWGQSRARNIHVPLKVRVRQMSYQWSYEYIKNLVYVEFNITNMNINSNPALSDTLFDCAMGIYMDSDVGPQSYGPNKASDDVSGYVMGPGYEFAYTYDLDGDGGLSKGMVGSRVCTPDPEQLKFSCWYWKVGVGPDDSNPQVIPANPSTRANEKYWLLTGRNPRSGTDYAPLRGGPAGDQPVYEHRPESDTRYLFAFYGAQPGTTDYSDMTKRWNLAPGKTMKIVVAVFPGDTFEDLKRSARWAKEIYGTAQNLTTVVLPDTFPHYNPPEPPEIPKLFAEILDDGKDISMYWDNRSEFSYDIKTVSTADIGWQNPNAIQSPLIDSDPTYVDYSAFPNEYKPNGVYNPNARVNPYTGYRLRHDFQGYTVWGRTGSGSQEDWDMIDRWDKIETDRDKADYQIDLPLNNYGGYIGADKGLPTYTNIFVNDSDKTKFYRYDDNYKLVPVQQNDTFYGMPIYHPDVEWTQSLQDFADAMVDDPTNMTPEEKLKQTILFKYPKMRDDIYLSLVDDKMIPLLRHGGQTAVGDTIKLAELRKSRLARRYYHVSIPNPPRGIEYYAAITAFDRGIPAQNLDYLESGRDADANMKVFFPGSLAKNNMNNIYVVPNPYVGSSKFDGRRENDRKGDKSKRLWFVNLPQRCKIRIYTLAGDLVDEINHTGAYNEDIINVSKAATLGVTADGIHAWDLLSKHKQIIASGVYLFSVENKDNGKIKTGKFVIIK